MKGEKSVAGHLTMFIVNVIFGLNTPVSKTLIPEFLTSYSLNYLRVVVSMVLFWGASFFVKEERVERRELVVLLFAAVLGIILNQFLFVKGLSLTTPINAAMIVSLTPIITMLMAAIYIREPITGKKVGGVLLGAAGALVLIVSGSDTEASRGANSMLGNMFCLASSVAYALYLTVFKGIINKHHPVTIMKWMFLYSAILTAPICWTDICEIEWNMLSVSGGLRILYVTVLATFVTYLLIPVGQKRLRPTTLSMYNYVQPIIACTVAVAIGIDEFKPITIIATIMIFSGVYIVTQSKARSQM